MKHFDFEEERVKREILEHGARRVLIQLPEGLKPEGPRLAKSFERLSVAVIVSADPCYGACDLATTDAENLGADMIVHYGHSKMLKHEKVPTVYVEARATLGVDDAVQAALPLLGKWKRVGLVTTVQHVQTLDTVRELLVMAGKTVMVGDAGKLDYAGQVVGCDYSNAKSIAKEVDAFLFVGGGRFHALGVALSTSKPTVVADPYEKRAFPVDEEAQRILRQRWATVEKAMKSDSFGVIVGLKPGQKRLEEAFVLKKKLDQTGRVACLLSATEITPETLMEFPTIDAFVNTACPRVSLDDASKFQKPVLTVDEALVVVGELSWEELCRKGLFGN